MCIKQLSLAKRMVILSGFDTNVKRSIARRQILAFLNNVMNVDVTLEDHYFIGNKHPKEIVLTLATISDKKKIFRNIDTIKKLVNSDGKRYIFRDYLTNYQQQFSKCSQNIAEFVNTLEPVEQEEVSIHKGDIYI